MERSWQLTAAGQNGNGSGQAGGDGWANDSWADTGNANGNGKGAGAGGGDGNGYGNGRGGSSKVYENEPEGSEAGGGLISNEFQVEVGYDVPERPQLTLLGQAGGPAGGSEFAAVLGQGV